jgi:hypothetical protein
LAAGSQQVPASAAAVLVPQHGLDAAGVGSATAADLAGPQQLPPLVVVGWLLDWVAFMACRPSVEVLFTVWMFRSS